MHPKLSYWLEKSSGILKDRISRATKEETKSYSDELNIRRELIKNSTSLFPDVTEEMVVGHYQIVGANSSNTNVGYNGILTLVKFENRIQATWQLEGSDIQTGFGLLMNNILSLNFNYEIHGKHYTGLVTYEFLSDRIVSGVWVEEGNDEIGVEFARKLPVKYDDPLKYFGIN